MKKELVFFILTAFIFGCKKNSNRLPNCNWFPIVYGNNLTYIRTNYGNNIPPYPTSETNGAVTSDNELRVEQAVFTISNCDEGKVLLHYYNASNMLLFDKNKSLTCCTQTTLSTSLDLSIKQMNNGAGTFISELKSSSNSYPQLRVTFTPNVGITYIDEINVSNGNVMYSYKLK